LHVVHDATEGTPSFPDGEVIIAQRNFNSSQGCHIGIIGGSAGESAINFGDKDNSDVGNITYNHSANRMEFVTNATERMRIDSSGILMVGKSATTLSVAGTYISPTGSVGVTRASDDCLTLNRTGNDGAIASFYKDGTTVGSIGTEVADGTTSADLVITAGTVNASRLWLKGGDSGLILDGHTNSVLPTDENSYEDNRTDLGNSNYRFKDLYLSGVATMGGASYDSSKTLKVSTVGTTNTNYAFYGIGTQTGADGRLNYWDFTNTNNSSAYFVYAQASGSGNVFNIRGDGDVENLNNSYGAVSDQKLKENIQDASSQWDDLKAIQVKKYSLISDELNEPNQIGVIAQELEAAGMSGLVKNSPDINMETGEDLGTVTKTVKYSVLYMKALKALQEAMNRIETLETRIAALEE